MRIQSFPQKILQILYEKHASNSFQALNSEDLGQQMGLSWEQIQAEVTYLEQKGYVVSKTRWIRSRLFHYLYLTTSGIELIEGLLVNKLGGEAQQNYHYNLKNIRVLLNDGFSAEELRRLCFDEAMLRPVYDQLAHATGKAQIIDLLLAYAEQKLQIEQLLSLTKELNPAQYEKHQPYYTISKP